MVFFSGKLEWRTALARLLIITGLAMIAYYYGTGVYTFTIQRNLRHDWARLSAGKVGRPGGRSHKPSLVGQAFGRLRIPKLGLDVIVLEGADRSTLMRGPGHITGTAVPESRGNTAISGHRTTFGAPFAELDRLATGDRVVLNTLSGEYVYIVSGRAVVKPTDLAVIGQQFKDRLTLTTCDPPSSAVRRLAVWARRSEGGG